ncbi:ATP-binding protein [Candidatus Latescibacterota bacterium]
MKCSVFEYKPTHSGLNSSLISESMMAILNKTNGFNQVFIEIKTEKGNFKAYSQVWCDDNEKLQNISSDVFSIGLETPLLETCSIHSGDFVNIRPLNLKEIKEAKTIELQLANSKNNIQFSNHDLKCIKNRILCGDLILCPKCLFTVPLRKNDAVKEIEFIVKSVEPQNGPIRCSDSTKLKFDGLSVIEIDNHQSFKDIGGLDDIVNLIIEMFCLPTQHPEIFSMLDITPPKGLLLHGSSGNGKTLIAKSVANEINATFIKIKGPEIKSKFSGEGERKIREVFKKARDNQPSVILIDEADSIGGNRNSFTSELEISLVSQLLSEMDGLEDRGEVYVIMTTNRPNALDEALRRPGRLDREIEIPLPSESARLEILKLHSRKIILDNSVDLKYWAKRTTGYSGAFLAALVREATIRCIRRVFIRNSEGQYIQKGNICVTNDDFSKAYNELKPPKEFYRLIFSKLLILIQKLTKVILPAK